MNLKHVGVPLALEEGKSSGEAHGFEGLGSNMAGNFQVNKVLSFERLAGDWALASHSQLLQDQAFLKDVSIMEK